MKAPHDQAVRDRLIDELETSFAVGAGAGSGKTRVLVDRVIQLVDSGFDLERIVAITFTEKASAELRERVRAVLSEAPEPDRGPVRERRLEALGKVDFAHLTTIHGFCRSILARHPLEAGVTPGFTVLDRLQSDLLLDDAASDVVSRLREEDCEELESALLAGGRLAGLRGLVRAVLRFPDLKPEHPGPAAEGLEEVAADLLETARVITGYADSVPLKDRLLQQAVAVLEQESRLAPGRGDPHELASVLERAAIHKNAGSKGNWNAGRETEEAFTRLKSEWSDLSRRRTDALAVYEGQHFVYMIEKAEEIRKEFERRKAELGALDFDDLLLRTEGLLSSRQQVVEQIKEDIQFVLVDEFQDTDPIQVRIVQRLAEAVGKRGERIEDAIPGAGRLFLVGDANQSIYRFRRADLSVFKEARARLLENGDEARLEVNFRSTPRLVRVANRMFPQLLGTGEYCDLTAHREEDASGPAVSLLDLDPFLDEDSPAGEVRVAEARALAGWIRNRIESGWQVHDKALGEWRPLAYRDVAVLVRTYTGVPVFEDELDRCGIPYRVSGGRAFFQRLEILQTLPVLRALSDPEDEVAAVASYRSPYFGVSDESLVRWAASGKPFSYIDGEDNQADEAFIDQYLDPVADAPLMEARRMMSDLHCQAQSCSPSGLLWKVFESTRALPLHALKPDGDRRMANLLKLADLAYAYEEAAAGLVEGGVGDFVSLGGLVQFLEEQRRAAVEEESVLVEEEGDAVTLMTIHAAKGLEFPVVALMDRSYKSVLRDEAIPNRREGTVTVTGAGMKPPEWEERKVTEAAEQEAESRRLLYVAFTRARDHVVLCGRRSDEGEGKGFIAPLEAALRQLADGAEGDDETAGLVEWIVPSIPELKDTVPHRLPYDLEEPSKEEVDAAVAGRHRAEQEWRETVVRAMRSPITRASKLNAKSELERPIGKTPPAAESRLHARLRGIRVHAAMELVALLGKPHDEACRIVSEPGDSADLESQVCELVGSGVALLDEVRGEGWTVAATEWPLLLGDANKALRSVVDEWVEVLTGTVDLVLEGADGELLVVDYKTGRAGPEVLRRLYGRQLQAYKAMLEMSAERSAAAEIWSLSTGKRIQLVASP